MVTLVDLPSAQALARLANTATQMLYGVPTEFNGPCNLDLPTIADGHTVVIPLIGTPTYVISAKANGDGGYGLAKVMFECPMDAVDGHTVIVPLIGEPLYIVTAKANAAGGVALASVMFECAPAETDSDMIEDSLRELTNILAGQVKTLIAQEHQLGLPSRLDNDSTLAGSSHWAGARLQIGTDLCEVDIAIAEYSTPEN